MVEEEEKKKKRKEKKGLMRKKVYEKKLSNSIDSDFGARTNHTIGYHINETI